MKSLNKEFIMRILIYTVGIIILTFGVAIFVATDNGADPFTMLMIGVGRTFKRIGNIGNAGIVLNFIIMATILCIDKSYIKIATVITALLAGKLIDFFLVFVSVPISELSIFLNVILMLISLLILCFGIAIVVSVNIGTGPYDLIGIIINDKTKFQLKFIRPIYDAISIVLGFLLGAKFGFGTIVSMIFIGPILQFMLKYTNKYINLIVKN
jgi:uncharacterized protein